MNITNKFTANQIDTFWNKVNITDRESCWEHTCETCTINLQRWKVSRVSWLIHFNIIPDKMDVRKFCRNRKCVNPYHLYLLPTFKSDIEFDIRFENNIIKTDYCWNWIGRKNEEGYGLISNKGIQYRAHRISYVKYKGTIPKNLIICHKCNNSSCVNPDHLYAGTNKDNSHDMVKAMRCKMGSANKNSKIDENTVILIRKLYADGMHSQYELASNFNVSQPTISAIVTNRIWKHI